jgi:hypothetical protein
MRYSWLDVVMFIAAIALLIPLAMKFAEVVTEALGAAY